MIGVLISIDTYYGRCVMTGAEEYASKMKNARWCDLVLIPPRLAYGDYVARYRLTGLVVAILNKEMERQIAALGIPAVNVADFVPVEQLPSIAIDDYRVGEKAAEYFLAKGYRHFAYLPEHALGKYTYRRGVGFAKRVSSAGFEVSWFDYGETRLPMGAVRDKMPLIQWLKKLPKPVALLASEDRTAADIHATALVAGFKVPEQIAILGVDNDPSMHYMGGGISSIELPMVQMGSEGAALLDQLLDGETADALVKYLPPGEVVTRSSTDTQAIEDEEVVRALSYIRENAHKAIGVDDVARAVLVGRRTLERHFLERTGVTINQEIVRIRIHEACRILGATKLGMKEVARLSGFESLSHFFTVFQKHVKMTPAAYRKQMR